MPLGTATVWLLCSHPPEIRGNAETIVSWIGRAVRRRFGSQRRLMLVSPESWYSAAPGVTSTDRSTSFPARYRVDLCVHRRRLPGRGDTTRIAGFPKSGCSAMPCSTSRRRQSASVSPLSFARLSRHHEPAIIEAVITLWAICHSSAGRIASARDQARMSAIQPTSPGATLSWAAENS